MFETSVRLCMSSDDSEDIEISIFLYHRGVQECLLHYNEKFPEVRSKLHLNKNPEADVKFCLNFEN